jgi:hypothetical protein
LQRGQRAGRGNFEDRAAAKVAGIAGPTTGCCPVQVPIAGLG